ncbi:MAG: peptide deformylase [Treponema sp.]|nr:peptide deformylase [Spirochaetia bacterium]MDD7460509.1 peptide deformylase [Spirochaetales bacterium]MDY5812055.1 peptide deformylase [Treponema sp.]MEE1182244.1 peptide deformylase [Treponema sp.]
MRITKLGEDILRQKCEAVKPEEINDEFRATLNEMFQTMESANGVGLAAPQVGIAKRFFVLQADDEVKRVFINPEITKTSAETSSYEEGCLSLPGFYEEIVRPVKVSVSALDENGKHFVINDADGLLARIIQHENDHLDGILYIDRGDEAYKQEVIESMKRKAERAAKKAAAKEAKQRSIEAKIAAKAARKNK